MPPMMSLTVVFKSDVQMLEQPNGDFETLTQSINRSHPECPACFLILFLPPPSSPPLSLVCVCVVCIFVCPPFHKGCEEVKRLWSIKKKQE